MKFLIAKHDIICKGCSGFIQRGDDMVQTFFPIAGTGKSIPLSYHTQCYIPWYERMFLRKWNNWKNGIGNPPQLPKVGRPVKYTDPTKAVKLRRLTSLLSYHKKLGHENKIKLIKSKIDKL